MFLLNDSQKFSNSVDSFSQFILIHFNSDFHSNKAEWTTPKQTNTAHFPLRVYIESLGRKNPYMKQNYPSLHIMIYF